MSSTSVISWQDFLVSEVSTTIPSSCRCPESVGFIQDDSLESALAPSDQLSCFIDDIFRENGSSDSEETNSDTDQCIAVQDFSFGLKSSFSELSPTNLTVVQSASNIEFGFTLDDRPSARHFTIPKATGQWTLPSEDDSGIELSHLEVASQGSCSPLSPRTVPVKRGRPLGAKDTKPRNRKLPKPPMSPVHKVFSSRICESCSPLESFFFRTNQSVAAHLERKIRNLEKTICENAIVI